MSKFATTYFRETLINKTKFTPMASKKYILVMALLALIQTVSFAQTPGSASDAYVFDSSKVSTKHLPQYNDFQKNVYPYPAKQKSQLEIGGGFGNSYVFGGHPILQYPGHVYNGGITGDIQVRKALSHAISLRGGYSGSLTTIPHEQYSTWYFGSAKSFTHALNADFIYSINTASPYRGNPKWNVYLFTGYNLVATYVQRQVDNNNTFSYHTLYVPQRYSIATFGGTANANGTKDWQLLHAYSLGGGWAFKINSKFNFAMEERLIIPFVTNNYLDGNPGAGAVREKYSYSTLRLNMNIGNPATHVEPLWWINPNNYVYSELNKPHHLNITPILPDADGDGVTDQFDLEPNTPAGAPVDTHGRALDTDGDGVPDYRDKEKLTPQNCFPVNADGVGTCPEPACCTELRKRLDSLIVVPKNTCTLANLPSIAFKPGSHKLSNEGKALLATAAAQLKANPYCNVKAVGYVNDATKRDQQLSWDRVNEVIRYLADQQGISESRIIFSYETSGKSNSIDLIPTTETEGLNVIPTAPNQHFRSNK
jgi:outer membrane protein OmpA-like peptidoglycan-associated protein